MYWASLITGQCKAMIKLLFFYSTSGMYHHNTNCPFDQTILLIVSQNLFQVANHFYKTNYVTDLDNTLILSSIGLAVIMHVSTFITAVILYLLLDFAQSL